MPLRNIDLDSIEESDLQRLVDNRVSEKKTIEFKASLPGNTDSKKKDFLAGVSSFANALGGDLICGIKERAGKASEVCGIQIDDSDAAILRIENMILDGVEPRIPGISTRAIPLEESRVAIIVRIPRSWALPHMVKFKKHTRFYSRTSAGKYPLDVQEMRALFVLSETTTERIRNFRVERIGNIVARETPVLLEENPKIVLHIVPIGAFDPAKKYDLSLIAQNPTSIRPMGVSSWSHRYNFDGFLTFGHSSQTAGSPSYFQIFHNGSIESVNSRLLRSRGNNRIIPSLSYERDLIEVLRSSISTQRELNIEPPLFVMLSLLEVSGYTMAIDTTRYSIDEDEIQPIDRDVLMVPEVLIEHFDCSAADVLKPAFDAVWNAAGLPRSMNYDDDGNWL